MASATRRFTLWRGLFVSLDGRVSATYIRVPIADGHASVPNAAFHLHAGLGYLTGRPAGRETSGEP
jgi:hypothetical protein